MKFSRPALASAAAVALALSSITVVNSAQVSEPLAVAPLDDATTDLLPADLPAEDESEKSADAPEGASETDPVDPANPVDSPDPALPKIDEDVSPEIVQKADEVPDTAAEPDNLVKMERLLEAPVKPGTKESQSWFSRTYKTIEKKDENGKVLKDEKGNTLYEKVLGPDGLPVLTDVEAWTFQSPSMKNRPIPVAVIPAKDANGNKIEGAPTLYMLNGAGGSEQNADWIASGGAHNYFRGKPVNVVIPMEGAFSYYVDWLEDGETLRKKSRYFQGEQKWTTFLGKELLPTVEHYLKANDKRAVVGMSMSATSSLLLAEHYPGKFDAVGSFSGCAATSTPLPWAFAGLTVNRSAENANFSDITPAHAWGPMGSPYNRYNDALVNAEKLRGSKLYISNASGLAATEDMYSYRRNVRKQESADAISGSMTTTVEGGVIEGATNACTHDLRAKLNSLDIPAHYEFKNAGTHSWPVWKDDMERSWNTVIGPRLLGDAFVADENLPAKSSWDAEKSS